MEQIPCYGDEREQCGCLYCGEEIETVEHCPSKVFLGKPYPNNLAYRSVLKITGIIWGHP